LTNPSIYGSIDSIELNVIAPSPLGKRVGENGKFSFLKRS
jgi:hypothetical protein